MPCKPVTNCSLAHGGAGHDFATGETGSHRLCLFLGCSRQQRKGKESWHPPPETLSVQHAPLKKTQALSVPTPSPGAQLSAILQLQKVFPPGAILFKGGWKWCECPRLIETIGPFRQVVLVCSLGFSH